MSLLALIKPKADTGPVWRVRARKDTIVGGPRARGDVFELPVSEAAHLVADEILEKLAVLDSDGKPVPPKAGAIRPTKNKPAPLPIDWKDLPPVFEQAWRYVSERRALVADIRAMEDAAIPPDVRRARKYAEPREKSPDDYIPLVRFVSDDEYRQNLTTNEWIAEAKRALDDFDSAKGDVLARALLAAGIATIQEIDTANAENKTLADLALDVFGARAAALELARAHLLRLFSGSGLAERYASLVPLSCDGAILTGGSSPGRTLDVPIEQMVRRYREAKKRREMLSGLRADAEAELAATRGATSPAPTKRRAG